MIKSLKQVLRKKIDKMIDRRLAIHGLLPNDQKPSLSISASTVDAVLANLGRLVVGNNPNASYFNTRFRNLELMNINIKTLGYAVACELLLRLSDLPTEPPEKQMLPSKLCTQEDIESYWLRYWCLEIKAAPIYHRKIWELCYIAQNVYAAGYLQPTMKGIGFGVGQEPLPSLFAKYGVKVLATDLAPEESASQGWIDSNQHASCIETLRRRDICDELDKLRHIELQYVDMNNIPDALYDRFDFCWSSCALEHLGSLHNGLEFTKNSMKTLKKGGIAIHTTEYTFDEKDTIDEWPTVLFQKRHFLHLVSELEKLGFMVGNIDFSIGSGVLDRYVDMPPYPDQRAPIRCLDPAPHLKLSVDGFPCTSIGITVRKI